MSRRLKFALILFLAISLGSLVLSEVELPRENRASLPA